VQDTLSPLLKSRYHYGGESLVASPSPLAYPIYPFQSSYINWVNASMSNLIRKLDDSDISTIFKVCRNLKDNNIPAFLLAHLILYNVLIDQSDFIENLVAEILAVLNDVSDSPSRPDDDLLIDITSKDREKREMCTQVIDL
jgi:serine/threonine-protein kinase ATR